MDDGIDESETYSIIVHETLLNPLLQLGQAHDGLDGDSKEPIMKKRTFS